MKKIPETENAAIIRTDFTDDSKWQSLVETVSEERDFSIFNMTILDDHTFDGKSVEELLKMIPEDYPHAFLMIADADAINQTDHPIVVVDLLDDRGKQFRAIANCVSAIDSNLSIGNMGFEEFANCVDDAGVHRGFPDM